MYSKAYSVEVVNCTCPHLVRVVLAKAGVRSLRPIGVEMHNLYLAL